MIITLILKNYYKENFVECYHFSTLISPLIILALHMRHYAIEKERSQSLRNSSLAVSSISGEFSSLNPVRLETLLPWITARRYQRINGCTVFRKEFKTSFRIIS